MSRFYASPNCIRQGKIILCGREAHHARDVMRLKDGDKILVFDGSGKEYAGVIEDVTKQSILVRIDKVIERDSNLCRLALIQAIPKLNKMDTIVEKAAELGVERIVPVITARTIVQTEGLKAGLKTQRWKRIAFAASKQCGRVVVPVVDRIMSFKDSLSYAKDYELAIIPCLCEGTKALRGVLKNSNAGSAVVFIGPEGDFTEEEIAAAGDAGIIPVLLGREVLRSDTAAVSVLSILNYELRWKHDD